MAALQMTHTATLGGGDADEGAGGGEGARPYLQIAVAGVPTAASAERVVPVGIQTDIQLTRTATNGDGDADEGAGGLSPLRRRRNDEVPVGLPVAFSADWATASGGGVGADPESEAVTDSFQLRYQSHQHRAAPGFVVATGFVPDV